jgi:uncharacterized ferritin-like protein (DUF455 family)
MEINEFARQLLFSDNLTDKLSSPREFTDKISTSPLLGSPKPGRPPEISFKTSKLALKSPTPKTIVDRNVRGAALYTFAHHELQAIELMALALLKFPKAPKGFRLGLANIIKDEQLHFKLYQRAAERTGVAMKDVKAGEFFWKTVEGLSTVAEFIAALSLTFEQANLDFTLYWKSAFEAIDEFETAKSLQRVYDDEVRHVRHGVRWFNNLTDNGGFEVFKRSLHFPLSVGRAKGPIFDRKGRELAGLSDHFIDEMEISNTSRGRPPNIYTFNPFIEEEVAGREVSKKVRYVKEDLAAIMWPLALSEDIVVAKRPSTTTLLRLSRAGFRIPEFVSSQQCLSSRPIGLSIPWGINHLNYEPHGAAWSDEIQQLFDKRFAFHLRKRFGTELSATLLAKPKGDVCETLEQVKALVKPGRNWIAKEPFSTSGQHRKRISASLSKADVAWLNRAISRSSIIVEPWYTRTADISVQLEVGERSIKIVGVTRFWTSKNGSFKGSQIGGWGLGLPPATLRAINQPQRQNRGIELIKSSATIIAETAKAFGFRGALGVDSMIVEDDGEIAVVPGLEINPRHTMGRVALAISSRCTGVGGWFFITESEIVGAGHENTNAFLSKIENTEIETSIDGKSLISGTLFTTEPRGAQRLYTVLCVDKTMELAKERWSKLGFAWPI